MATEQEVIIDTEELLAALTSAQEDLLKAKSGTITSGAYNNNRYIIVDDDDPASFSANSAVYAGSLSAQGSMTAMVLNTGNAIEAPESGDSRLPGKTKKAYNPYLSGYFRSYYLDPRTCTFGADSGMPALTGVMPPKYSDTPGNFAYYVDLQLTRLSGSDVWDNYYFINSLNQCISWVLTANDYLASLGLAEKNNLKYYGANDYSSLITQGFNRYQSSQAVRLAFSHVGKTAATISDGYFGTPNAVAKSLIENGLGYISNFSQKLFQAGVNVDDIYNEIYTPFITEALRSINNPTDLATIQQVLNSSISQMTTALDYISLEKAAGIANDSIFPTLADIGKDIYSHAPNLIVQDGAAITLLIDNVQSQTGPSVEGLSTPTSLLPQSVIDSLRNYLPQSADYKPISILNVIGTASGYYTDQLNQVNIGIARLYATSYGPQLRSILEDITRYYAGFALTDAEFNVSNPESYYAGKLEATKSQYLALIKTILADTSGEIPDIVNQINTNYDYICSKLSYEYTNYNRANISVSSFSDNNQLFSFVSSLPGLGADPQNLGTDFLMYNLCQPNDAGNVAATIIGQSKNNQLLGEAGVRIKGIL